MSFNTLTPFGGLDLFTTDPFRDQFFKQPFSSIGTSLQDPRNLGMNVAPQMTDRQIGNWEQKHYLHTDIIECDDCYCIHVDVPGVPCEDITVEITEHSVMIKGHREPMKKDTDRMMRGETYRGDFHRTIRLPRHAMDEGATVTHCNGCLCITLKKDTCLTEKSHRRKLEVKHAPSSSSKMDVTHKRS